MAKSFHGLANDISGLVEDEVEIETTTSLPAIRFPKNLDYIQQPETECKNQRLVILIHSYMYRVDGLKFCDKLCTLRKKLDPTRFLTRRMRF